QRSGHFALQALVLLHQLLLGLLLLGVDQDAVHGAHLDALRLVIVAHALGAEIRVDLVDLVALGNRTVGALGLAHIAVDAFIGDHQSHGSLLGNTSDPRSRIVGNATGGIL